MRQRFLFGLAYERKDIVFRFIIEYSSLEDFGPYVTLGVLAIAIQKRNESNLVRGQTVK